MNNTEITKFRAEIDAIDNELILLLARRMDICTAVGQYKRINSLPIEDCAREQEILASKVETCPKYSTEIKELYSLLFAQSKRLQRSCFNLYLIGMPDCGKTRYGRSLSVLLNRPLADTDQMVMNATGKTIDELFDKHGESFFRRLESIELMKTAAVGGLVVATGGGILKNTENIMLMKHSGIIIFLNRKLEKLLNQKIKNRPLLRQGASAVERLYHERLDTYTLNANFIIDPDEDGAAERIAEFFLESIR